ncbi:MAG TPA: acetoacetate decarboxylase family protein [Acidimicrobiales bacterium]|nr:acetoacetate decarboxylase family protein [Acidimicrobiales bacterium]
MITYGTRDVALDAVGAPTVDLSEREPLELTGGEILQTVYELPFTGFAERIPPALHPTHPPLAHMFFYKVPDSPVGPFTMAQVRTSALAGISRWSYPIAGWVDNADAADYFGRRWGYALAPAAVDLQRRHDRIWGTVAVDGRVILETGMFDPEPVNGTDATHVGHLNVAHVDRDGAVQPTLVQAGPQLSFRRCDRGRPQLVTYDLGAIGGDEPYWAVSAYTGTCNFLFSPVSFICDPNQPVMDGGLILSGSLQAI